MLALTCLVFAHVMLNDAPTIACSEPADQPQLTVSDDPVVATDAEVLALSPFTSASSVRFVHVAVAELFEDAPVPTARPPALVDIGKPAPLLEPESVTENDTGATARYTNILQAPGVVVTVTTIDTDVPVGLLT